MRLPSTPVRRDSGTGCVNGVAAGSRDRALLPAPLEPATGSVRILRTAGTQARPRRKEQ